MAAIFDLEHRILAEHIDSLGHTNNVLYVQWMQDIATQHIAHLGLGLNEFQVLRHAMVAVEHRVQYRKATLLGDALILRTWLDDLSGLYSSRQYAFWRPIDQTLVFVGHTKWACVEIATGRPKRMSPTFLQAYQPLDQSINPWDFSQSYVCP